MFISNHLLKLLNKRLGTQPTMAGSRSETGTSGLVVTGTGTEPKSTSRNRDGPVPVVPGFLRAATTPGGQVPNPDVFDSLYVYSWFVTFAIGFVLYYVLMKLFPSHTEDGHLG